MRSPVDITVFEWNGIKWDGWWKGDTGVPVEHRKVELTQQDKSKRYIGQVMSFDIPNGDDYSPHEKGLDRHVMEGVQIDFWSGDFTLEGFVRVEQYGKDADDDLHGGTEYRKQRWVVRGNGVDRVVE